MASRCPECLRELPEDAVWVCPACAYTLRTPAVAKFGIAVMVLGLALVGAYLMGPDQLGLESGWMPTQLAELTVEYFPLLVLGVLLLGMALVAIGAIRVRVERSRARAAA